MKAVLLSNAVPFLMGLMTATCLFESATLYGGSLVTLLASHSASCDCCCGGKCTCSPGQCQCPHCKCIPGTCKPLCPSCPTGDTK